jgi:hypothetical protein
MVNIKTDEKKQHFDDIYVEPTPVPYKIRILDALDYISDDFSKLCRAVHLIPSNDALTSSSIVSIVHNSSYRREPSLLVSLSIARMVSGSRFIRSCRLSVSYLPLLVG